MVVIERVGKVFGASSSCWRAAPNQAEATITRHTQARSSLRHCDEDAPATARLHSTARTEVV